MPSQSLPDGIPTMEVAAPGGAIVTTIRVSDIPKIEEQVRQQVREELLSRKTLTAVRALYAQRGINKPVGAVRLDLETALGTTLATLDHKGETDAH